MSARMQLDQSTHQCQACAQYIQERYFLQVMDKAWHLNCLRCVDCKQSLDSQQTCFAKDGLIYCKEDYYKRFPRKCHNCFQAITPNEFIMRARHLIFHFNCFKCLVCERQLNTGDEYGLSKDGLVYCRLHYTFPTNTNINNESLIEFNTNTNSTMCNMPPTPGISPPNTSVSVSPNSSQDLLCDSVSNSQSTSKGRPKKRKLTETKKKSSNSKQTSTNTATIKQESKKQETLEVNNNTNNNTSTSVDSPEDYSKHFDSNLDYFSDNEDDFLDTSSSNGQTTTTTTSNGNTTGYYDSVAAVAAAAAAAAAAAQRQKRMRTSFKHHQLRVMKSYFELNHNPDAKDLKQLSQKTGLSKRVLQVWFQNARAKFRRGQSNPCGDVGADPVSGQGATTTSNTGVSSSSTSSISSSSTSSSSSSSSSSQQNQLSCDMALDDSSSHSLSLDTANGQTNNQSTPNNQSSNEFNYTLLSGYQYNPLNTYHSHHHHHQSIIQHSGYYTPGAQSQQTSDSNLIVDNLII